MPHNDTSSPQRMQPIVYRATSAPVSNAASFWFRTEMVTFRYVLNKLIYSAPPPEAANLIAPRILGIHLVEL